MVMNVIPSKKSLEKALEAIQVKTGPRMCFKPVVGLLG